jgi:hypothetical protein
MSFDLKEYVKDKQIILVGNSNTLKVLKKGEFIDSYEIIIRFNLAMRYLNPEITGIKTDIWSYAMVKKHICIDTYQKARYKPNVCLRYGPEKIALSQKNDECFIPHPYKQECKELLELEGTRKIPSSGFVLLYFISNYCSPKSITIIGFDSFQNPNFYTDFNSNAKFKWHDSEKESQYINSLQFSSRIPVKKI